jgi:O-antigen/teichoic acid export membrane protein
VILIGKLRGLAGKVTAPLLSQGVTAGTSLLLQIVAARALGLAGYGAFALCLALLVSATALYSAFVGDSIAVLDRHQPDTRAALVTSALAGLVLVFSVGIVVLLLVGGGTLLTALVYAAMLVLWLLEETFRRLFMARLEFWKLVGNDVTYLVATVAALFVLYAVAGTITLAVLFAAMGLGALAAVVAGFLASPASELRRLAPGVAGMRAVASFAAWRSAQGALRPTALLFSRTLVANLASLTAVGVLEAGRLVVAPLQVVINGAGSFLLSSFAANERAGGSRDFAKSAVLLLTGGTVLCGLPLAVFAHPLGTLMTGEPVDPMLVLGWTAYLAVWAAGLPYVTEVVARKLSRAVFVVRLVDSAIGLALVLLVLLLGAGIALTPWMMAIGGLYSVWRLRSLAVRTRNTPAPGGALSADNADHLC